MTNDSLLRSVRFSTYRERADTVLARVLPLIPEDRAARVLDVGCGSGEALRAIAEVRPNAQLTGVDVSSESIEAAREAARALPDAERIHFEVGDYRQVTFPPADLLLCDGVLHFIPGPTEALV